MVTYRPVGTSPIQHILSGGSVDFQLTEDHLTARKWAHDFAEREIRPVAPEYDETEEFPWPVVKKAAEVGLYSMEFWTEMVTPDPTGLILPVVMEEGSWVGAEDAGDARGPQAGGLRRDRVRGRLRRVGAPDHGRPRRRRVGAERPKGVHHERRHRRRARGGGHGRPGAGASRPGRVHHRSGDAGAVAGEEGAEARHPCLAHRGGGARGLPDPAGERGRGDGAVGGEA